MRKSIVFLIIKRESIVFLIIKREFFSTFLTKKHNVRPISDRVSVTNKLDLGSIPCLAFSNKKGHREDSTVRDRQNVAA